MFIANYREKNQRTRIQDDIERSHNRFKKEEKKQDGIQEINSRGKKSF